MNRIPNPVNLVSKFIIIIVTNFTGKSGAKNQAAAKEKMTSGKMQIFHSAPPQVIGSLKSRSREKEKFFDNQCYL